MDMTGNDSRPARIHGDYHGRGRIRPAGQRASDIWTIRPPSSLVWIKIHPTRAPSSRLAGSSSLPKSAAAPSLRPRRLGTPFSGLSQRMRSVVLLQLLMTRLAYTLREKLSGHTDRERLVSFSTRIYLTRFSARARITRSRMRNPSSPSPLNFNVRIRHELNSLQSTALRQIVRPKYRVTTL
jgi:hypothetical protein